MHIYFGLLMDKEQLNEKGILCYLSFPLLPYIHVQCKWLANTGK